MVGTRHSGEPQLWTVALLIVFDKGGRAQKGEEADAVQALDAFGSRIGPKLLVPLPRVRVARCWRLLQTVRVVA
jgi:hypothetical protein